MAAWEDELRKLDLTRRVDQIEEDAHRGVNFLGLKVLYAEPSRTFAGMIVYADGTSWNPGSGEGFYRRNKDNSGWVYTTNFGTVTVDESGYLRGGQTDYATGTGFFLGHSGGAYKFSLGDPAGNNLTWDGSNLTVKGAIALGSTVQWADVAGSGKPSDNADVTLSAVNGGLAVTGGGITLTAGGSIKGGQTDYATGTGFFLGYSGAAYKFSIGSATKYLRWDGSSLSLRGDITSDSNISITGTARFEGSTSPDSIAISAAVVANDTGGQPYGVWGKGSTVGVAGTSLSASGIGVEGASTHASGVGVRAVNLFGGTALKVDGPTVIGNHTVAWNGYTFAAPTGSTSKFMRNDGTWENLAKALFYVDNSAPSNTATPAGWAKMTSQDGTVTAWFQYYT